MDTMPESAAVSFVRIQVLVMQGLLRSVILASIGIAFMPIMPFALAGSRFFSSSITRWKKLVMFPLWMVLGAIIAVISPFRTLLNGLMDTYGIAKVEWRERWRNGTAKFPDGRPMDITTPYNERMVEVSITKGVIEDYNEEARQHGQGIPPVD